MRSEELALSHFIFGEHDFCLFDKENITYFLTIFILVFLTEFKRLKI